MTKKYYFAILLLLPVLFFGKGNHNSDTKNFEPTTLAAKDGNGHAIASTTGSSSRTSKNAISDPLVVRSFKVSDADTAADSCFPTPGQGVIFQKLECKPGLHHIWRAGDDLVLTEYDNNTAKISGTVINEYGKRGALNVLLSQKESTGTTWKKQCYLDGLGNDKYFYRSFRGTLVSDGVSQTIAVKKAEQHYIFSEGASLEAGQFGFGAWTGGTFGECTEWFGTLTPIPACDITVDAGDDIEACTDENIELSATYINGNECITGCEYPVLDKQKCGGSSEEVYLFLANKHTTAERHFEATSQNFTTFSDGTARYTATASNGNDVIQVDMLYSGRTSTAPMNSPKTHSCSGDQDLANFEYYPTLNGTIVSRNHGTFYATSMGPSFQIGIGGDVTRTGFGASGWFDLTGGDGFYEKGDVNIALGNCVEQGTEEATFLWSTANGTIVGTADQQTIEVSESGTYTVTVTNCNGCEATDEVVVTVLEKLTVGDFVWEDLNRNGLQDTNEPGVDGVNVTLYNADGTVAAETVTTSEGAYSFQVCPGEYYIIFGDVPNGYEITKRNAGDDALDSDANANGRTPNFVLTDSNNPTIDAGIVASCAIDPSISGDEKVCSGEEAVLSATGGNTYVWSTGDTSDSITVSPKVTTTYTVTVSDNTIAGCEETLEFTVTVSEQLVVGDLIFEDVNRNGLQDADEAGVDGLSVTLYSADGTIAGNTTSANGGEYSFEVCPGEFYIVFGDVPADYTFTNVDAGDDTMDSDADTNGRTPNFVITDSDDTTIDAGLIKLCTIDPAVDGDKEICLGEEAKLTASGGDTYEWSTGATTASIAVSPKATTTYTVIVSDSTIPDCSEELTFTVTVQSITIDAGPDVSISFGDDTTLTVNGADASDEILWSTGETTTSIQVSPESETTYFVTVVNAFGCMDEDSVTVTVTNPCGMEPSFKILPRDQPGLYTPGYETAACIGDNLYLWMFDAKIDVLNEYNGQDYTKWSFTFESPSGELVVQNDRPNYPGNHRFELLDLTAEDFGDYKISWLSPSGCAGSSVFTLNFPDAGCGENGRRESDFYEVAAAYPIPAAQGSEITLEINTKSQGFNSLAGKGAATGNKSPEFVSRKETIKLSLYNMGGRLMASAKSYDVEQGKVKVYYQLGNLPSGNYIIKVDGANWTDSKQIIVK